MSGQGCVRQGGRASWRTGLCVSRGQSFVEGRVVCIKGQSFAEGKYVYAVSRGQSF